jgi:hypothetical protein
MLRHREEILAPTTDAMVAFGKLLVVTEMCHMRLFQTIEVSVAASPNHQHERTMPMAEPKPYSRLGRLGNAIYLTMIALAIMAFL